MSDENKANLDKDNLEKMVQHYVNGDVDAAQEYLSQVMTSKANRLFNTIEKTENEE